MAETLAGIRKAATQQEAGLLVLMQAAASLIVPPFTPKLRARIRDALGPVHQGYSQLNTLWYRHLHLPETRNLPQYGTDWDYFAGLRRRLNLAMEFQALLQRVTARQLAVMPDSVPGASPAGRLIYAYESSFYRLHDYLSPPRPNPEDYVGKHNDIPLPFTHFAQLMQLARRTCLAVGRKAPLSFIDVGCGVGLKVLQAAEVFEISQGLEYDATRVVVADHLIHHMRRSLDKVFQADALDYEGYGDFDVIYTYKPFSSMDLLIQMEQRMIEQAKPGTVFVMPYFEFEDRYEAFGLGKVSRLVYVKGIADCDMKPLLRRIANIGFIIPDDPNFRNLDEGFVAPLANALRHWGHLA